MASPIATGQSANVYCHDGHGDGGWMLYLFNGGCVEFANRGPTAIPSTTFITPTFSSSSTTTSLPPQSQPLAQSPRKHRDAQHKSSLKYGANNGGHGSVSTMPTTGGHKMAEALFNAFQFTEVTEDGEHG